MSKLGGLSTSTWAHRVTRLTYWALGLAEVCLLPGCSGPERSYTSDDPLLPGGQTQDEAQGPAFSGATGGSAGSSENNELDRISEQPASSGSVTGAQPEAAINSMTLEATCSDDSDCENSPCVDGFCCESSCDETCATCGAPGFEGQCRMAASDPLCPTVDCPTGTTCLGYDASTATNNCAAIGECRNDHSCSLLPEAAGTSCGIGNAGTCDGDGICEVPDKASLGEACQNSEDCAEGNCVTGADGAGLCCDTACDGVCEQCGANGRCDTAPEAEPRCDSVTCPPDNACRNYPDALEGGQCSGFGVCRDARSCLDAFESLRVEAECTCDDQGNCELLTGTSCNGDTDCGASNACEATVSGESICCARACGTGLFCSADGNGCVECQGSATRCSGNQLQRCESGRFITENCANGCTPGTGCNAAAALGFSCAQSQCQQGLSCQTDVSGTRRCCSGNCAAQGKGCATNGICQCPQGQVDTGNSCVRPNGNACQANNQCQGGRCVDGICCAEACDGFCEQCQAGSGLCVAVQSGQQDSTCNNTHQCTGQRNGCRALTGQSCTSNNGSDCVSGRCTAQANGNRVCCAQNCGGQTPFCRANGQSCVECTNDSQCDGDCNTNTGRCAPPVILLEDGENCTDSAQCTSNICTFWSEDIDGDGFGSTRPRGACGTFDPFGPLSIGTRVNRSGDCCDQPRDGSSDVFPNAVERSPEVNACGDTDWNCDGNP